MLNGGECSALAEVAAAERISRSYVCRVLRLTLLAPDIVDRIPSGSLMVSAATLPEPFPVEWEKQRTLFI
jgi:hypothetical protein